MGQNDVYEFLKKNKGKKYSCIDIQRATGINEASCMRSLLKLRRRRDIKTEFIIKKYSWIRLINGKEIKYTLPKLCRRYWI